jgi:hypothetical protein
MVEYARKDVIATNHTAGRELLDLLDRLADEGCDAHDEPCTVCRTLALIQKSNLIRLPMLGKIRLAPPEWAKVK